MNLSGKDLDNAYQAVMFWLMMNDTPQRRWKVEQALAVLPGELTGYPGGFDQFMEQIDNMHKLHKELAEAIRKETES